MAGSPDTACSRLRFDVGRGAAGIVEQDWYEIGNEDRGVSDGFSRKNPA
jgi:hypothetical protein